MEWVGKWMIDQWWIALHCCEGREGEGGLANVHEVDVGRGDVAGAKLPPRHVGEVDLEERGVRPQRVGRRVAQDGGLVRLEDDAGLVLELLHLLRQHRRERAPAEVGLGRHGEEGVEQCDARREPVDVVWCGVGVGRGRRQRDSESQSKRQRCCQAATRHPKPANSNSHEGRAIPGLHLGAPCARHERGGVDHHLAAQRVADEAIWGGAEGEAVLQGVGQLLGDAGDVGEEDVARLDVRPAVRQLAVAHPDRGLVRPDLGCCVVLKGARVVVVVRW